MSHKIIFFFLCAIYVQSMRDFRSWSNRSPCEVAKEPNYIYAYTKYIGQPYENKGRVNSNLQDFRHECQAKGGESKCHICADYFCNSDTGRCPLQFQGVDANLVSLNVPVMTDTPWAVGGNYRKDFGGTGVTHFCVFTSGGSCLFPQTTDFSSCSIRCFGYGLNVKPQVHEAPYRTVVDVHVGMGRWDGDGQVDLWEYPRNCSEMISYGSTCTYSNNALISTKTPSFNPQGFSDTVAGNLSPGFTDGVGSAARFNAPEDVAVDLNGIVYVADTANNAIRYIDPKTALVHTVAGLGPDHGGSQDGPCAQATFLNPKGLDVYLDVTTTPVTTVIIVADTGNDRIRRIDFVRSNGSCNVRCLSGLCGNNTLSNLLFKTKATPLAGYADGDGLYARFSAPESVAILQDFGSIYVVVADTNNYLIRLVDIVSGYTTTLAGTLGEGLKDPNGNPLPGCPAPCLVGISGTRDGNLSYAMFHNPSDVTIGPHNSIYVTDENRLRIIELPNKVTNLYGISSTARVSTIAGNSLQGYEDGRGDESSFFVPSGVFVTNDDIAYIADAGTCRIRRVTPLPRVAETLTCASRALDLVRPSGCTSFDHEVDLTGRKISSVEKNVQYNYGDPYLGDGDRNWGKYMKNCVGVPPPDTLDKHFLTYNVSGDNLVVDDHRVKINEDSESGMSVMVFCPPGCSALAGSSVIKGNTWYADESSVCVSAIHSGVLTNAGGYVLVTFQRRDYIDGTAYDQGVLANSIQSIDMNPDYMFDPRVFSFAKYNSSMNIVHTVAGVPSGNLTEGCGYADGQPATKAMFNKPGGIAAAYNVALTDRAIIYVADTGNNMIRALSATCTQICENGGTCTGPDTCTCAAGWTGIDCTRPICASACGANRVCVAPNTCGCKPGFGGASCTTPQCSQNCHNGGTCAFPDTCQCAHGWVNTNCTTPVCSMTCGNGGECVEPDVCRCPSQWTGTDCRTPVCSHTCHNGGFCVAPDTCYCPPQWIGPSCQVPVCTQGFFRPNDGKPRGPLYATNTLYYPTYKPCNIKGWCNSTNEFECDQSGIEYLPIEVPSGLLYVNITGRKTRPVRCMNIELPTTFKIPYELLYADNSTTGYRRYSPKSPYESNDLNPWRGYYYPVDGHTGPWVYTADRQLAFVDWLNVTQGVYVCANGGNCLSPDVCECAQGWGGFDCRTPICNQGYYNSSLPTYVSGQESSNELSVFKRFMGYNSYRLDWPYSNPQYTMMWETYTPDGSDVIRTIVPGGGVRYKNGATTNAANAHGTTYQGGYRCSIRSYTEYENLNYVFDHPNYYSRYMDKEVMGDGEIYSYWEDMLWPPVNYKSLVLDQVFNKRTYIYTDEGFRRFGIWNLSQFMYDWEYGICMMEFNRTCPATPSKALDLESQLHGVFVQDTDLSYRPRLIYDDFKVSGQGRWKVSTGECVDNVIRGCFNNGTCVGPDTCKCAPGWQGNDCSCPICDYCLNNGNCTLPNTCTCERGWQGAHCEIPMCAQECMNGGECVAPDVCKCKQWDNEFKDSRLGGGSPIYQNLDGSSRATGWTGYDCSIPICVQAETFNLNVKNRNDPGFISLGGHGGDGELDCLNSATGRQLPRCPQYDVYVTGNDGTSFQVGCGFDPYDVGCCIKDGNSATCYICESGAAIIDEHTYHCPKAADPVIAFLDSREALTAFKTTSKSFNVRTCGDYHSPRDYLDPLLAFDAQDYGTAVYFVDELAPEQSSFNYLSNFTSNRYLCNRTFWEQGNFVDSFASVTSSTCPTNSDGGVFANYLQSLVGVGSIYGLDPGRHIRINYPNLRTTLNSANVIEVKAGPKIRGEGVYACYNEGSCLGPDYCSCKDGYEGIDCSTPLCRHLQPTGAVSGCLNRGICSSRDHCDCIQVPSVLSVVYPLASTANSGWTGTDCSMPVCTQGYFDPFCTNNPYAPGGEGCFRCANGGLCTAPDVCTCAPGWQGFDCKTPICETVANPLIRTQLPTIFENKITAFESDPCGGVAIFGLHKFQGVMRSMGNCSAPNLCTCSCRTFYNRKACDKSGKFCDGAWQDPMVKVRNVLATRGVEYTFGSTDCADGSEGNVDEMNRFVTCHQYIFYPDNVQKNSIPLIAGCGCAVVVIAFIYYFVSVRLKRKFLLDKIARRRSKRSSEDSLTNPTDFGHK